MQFWEWLAKLGELLKNGINALINMFRILFSEIRTFFINVYNRLPLKLRNEIEGLIYKVKGMYYKIVSKLKDNVQIIQMEKVTANELPPEFKALQEKEAYKLVNFIY